MDKIDQGSRQGKRNGLLLTVLALALASASVCQARVHSVSGVVQARYFNENLSDWDNQTISVFYDDLHRVILMGGHGRGKVSVRLDQAELSRLKAALKLGSMRLKRRRGQEGVLELFRVIHGAGPGTHGLTLSYWSGDDQVAGAIVLFLQDDDNSLSQMELYLNEVQVRVLLKRLASVPM